MPDRSTSSTPPSRRTWFAEERAALAEELLGDVRRLAARLHALGLGEWTLGLEDLADELERRSHHGHTPD